eukprot:scaffold49309_cov48-Cyclotella_meneghiniana.AAC.4
MESCAACGKADVSLKSCKACKLVKYCGVDCQVAHRRVHKKACRIKAAELSDAQLYTEPPAREDCPICMRMLPVDNNGCGYHTCCGKIICNGCVYSLTRTQDRCPFCNVANATTDDERKQRLFERIEKYNDPEAILMLGFCYEFGDNGFPVDHTKAVELYKRASELGCAVAHYHLGIVYRLGRGVDQDRKKTIHHFQIAAMMGHVLARHNLGAMELANGKHVRAMRHFMIAAKSGFHESMELVKLGFKDGIVTGIVTKDDFEDTLRCFQASQDEMRSEDRDRAKAAGVELVRNAKAVRLYKHASELGSASGHYHLGNAYRVGTGVDKDREKATHHFHIADMMGHVSARHNVGCMEWDMIAAKSGYHGSLEMLKIGFKGGIDDYGT